VLIAASFIVNHALKLNYYYQLPILQDSDSVRQCSLVDHIIFMFDMPLEDISLGVELKDFLMPLRDSCIPVDELKTVVLYVSQQLICKAWDSIACYPRVFVFLVSNTFCIISSK